MNAPPQGPNSFDKKEIENLARHFNKAFGHAMMYGVMHQMTEDSIVPFHTALAAALAKHPLITVTLEHESVFFEGINVDKIVNAKKLVGLFNRAGIQSFSFEQGLTLDHLKTFLEVCAAKGTLGFADAIKQELWRRGAKSLRINYIVYRKMTADEEVIAKGAIVLPPGTTGGISPSDSFSITKMLRNPKAAAGSLFYASARGTPPQPDVVMSNVATLSSQIRQAASAGSVPADHLMDAVLVLREECFGHINDFKAAGLIDTNMDAVADELERLTSDTVIHLIREEYKSGGVSTKRLAQILRRMLPDRRELRRLLPGLKDALLAAGMPFVKYVELVNELRRELEGDDVLSTLAAATREMGVTPEDVIEEIRKHPADAARLIILSSELRRSGGANETGFEQTLTDYIEKVSQQMAISSTEANNPDNGRQLGAVLQKLESNLLDNLKKQGVEQSVLTALAARLMERLPYLLDITKIEWLRKALDVYPALDTGMLAKLIAGTVQQAVDIDTHRDSLFALCREKGLSPDQIQEVLHQAAAKVAAAAAQIDLPRGVLSSSAIMYFLERECKLSLRYHNHFSLLILSILRVFDENGTQRPLTGDERPLYTKTLITMLRGIMRDIDLIGVPSSTTESIVFVILPMTEESNTYGLVQRLRHELSTHPFEAGGVSAILNLAISITGFDYQSMADKTAFLKVAMAHHRASEKIQLSGINAKA